MYILSEKAYKKLNELASQSNSPGSDEDFMVDDYAGGNIDDAYYIGSEHGEHDGQIHLAYDILKEVQEFK